MKQDCLELTAISKTLYFFDSIIAKISVPINISKLNDSSEWYYLKNKKNENIIGVLISMYYDSLEKSCFPIFTNCESSFFAAKNNQNKNDISCDIIRSNNQTTNNLFLNIINRTNNTSFVNNSVDYITLKAQNQSNNVNDKKIEINKSNLKLDITMICDDNIKSPDKSLTNNLFSPFSCRFENDKMNLNLTNINSRINNNSNSNLINCNSKELHHSQNNFIGRKADNRLEISNNCITNELNENEIDNENFYDLIEKKLELIFNNNKDNHLTNMDNSTIIRSYNNVNNYGNSVSTDKEDIKNIIIKLKNKNQTEKKENEKIRKAKEDLKKTKESK